MMWEAADTPGRSAVSDDDLAGALRAWSRGSYRCEAAVELLIRAFCGRLLHGPWIKSTDSVGWYVDPHPMLDAGYLSSGELRVLLVVASLLNWQCPVDLGDVCSIDRPALDLVLAAIAHASGSHEHSESRFSGSGEWLGVEQVGTLYPWPVAAGSGTAAAEGAPS